MREYKFRGKRLDTGKLAYGYLVKQFGKLKIYDDSKEDFGDWLHEVDPKTVGQYTGLKDKNRKEIYEGDIVVAWSEGSKGTFIIKWRQEGAPMYILYPAWQSNQFWNLHGSKRDDGIYYDTVEIIGNKWDNPELLKEGNV